MRESAECLLETRMNEAYLRLLIESPTFEEILLKEQNEAIFPVQAEFEDADGKV